MDNTRHFIEHILFNVLFSEDIKPSLNKFFEVVLLPQILTGSWTDSQASCANTSDIAAGESKKYCLCGREEFGRIIAFDNLHCSLEWFLMNVLALLINPKENGIALLAKTYY